MSESIDEKFVFKATYLLSLLRSLLEYQQNKFSLQFCPAYNLPILAPT